MYLAVTVLVLAVNLFVGSYARNITQIVVNPIYRYVYPEPTVFEAMARNCTSGVTIDEMPSDCIPCKLMDTVYRRFCPRRLNTCNTRGEPVDFYVEYYGTDAPRHQVLWGLWESLDKP